MESFVVIGTLFVELLMLKVSSRDDFGPSWGVQFEFFRTEIFFADSLGFEESFLKKSASQRDGVEKRFSASRGDFRIKIVDLVSERPFGLVNFFKKKFFLSVFWCFSKLLFLMFSKA